MQDVVEGLGLGYRIDGMVWVRSLVVPVDWRWVLGSSLAPWPQSVGGRKEARKKAGMMTNENHKN